jgi:O-antigen ligase
MTEGNSFQQFYNHGVVVAINGFLRSKFFVCLIAVLTVLSNTLGLEFPVYIAVSLTAVLIGVFGQDFLPLVPIFIFMYFSPSLANNPGLNENSIFFPEHGLYVIIGFILVAVIALVSRVFAVEGKKFFSAKRIFLPSLLVLCITFLIGGIGTEWYTYENVRYVLLLCVTFIFPYYLFSGGIRWNKTTKDYFAWVSLMGGLVVLAELVFIYATQDILRDDGTIERALIHTGWGIHNNIGGVLVMFMPGAFYLASAKKGGCVYVVLGTAIFLGTVCTLSRTSILVSGCVYVFCAVWLVLQKKNRWQNLITYILLCVSIFLVYWKYRELFNNLFSQFFALGTSDSGRSEIYEAGIQMFLERKIFGNSFYACNGYQWVYVASMNFIPPRWHNTIIQILASCGIVGMTAYLLHRIQTIVVLFIHPDKAKIFVFLSILSLLLISLMDCHLFNIGPTIYYSMALAFFEKMPETKKEIRLLGGNGKSERDEESRK